MDKRKHIFWELVLLFGSIFAFRSVWHLMDKLEFFNDGIVLFISLILGLILMAAGYFRIVHADKGKH